MKIFGTNGTEKLFYFITLVSTFSLCQTLLAEKKIAKKRAFPLSLKENSFCMKFMALHSSPAFNIHTLKRSLKKQD